MDPYTLTAASEIAEVHKYYMISIFFLHYSPLQRRIDSPYSTAATF